MTVLDVSAPGPGPVRSASPRVLRVAADLAETQRIMSVRCTLAGQPHTLGRSATGRGGILIRSAAGEDPENIMIPPIKNS